MDSFEYPIEEPRLPPAEVRIRELRAEPWPDGRRVRVHTQITPFEQRPNLEITISDHKGEQVANVSIIELLDPKFVITMHIRAEEIEGRYTLQGRLYYPDHDPVDLVSHEFDLDITDET